MRYAWYRLYRASGYFAKQRNRRGGQLGRVLAAGYEEVVVDRLFTGKTQLTTALDGPSGPALSGVDASGGSLDDVNWLLSCGYQVQSKGYSGRHAIGINLNPG